MRTRPRSSTSSRPSTGSRISPPSVTEPGHPTMPAALPEAPPEVGTPLAPVVPGSAGVPRGRLADHVFRRLADDIVLGHLPPGQHLDEQAMAARYLMFEAIAELESACARHAALRMTEPQRQALVEAHAQGRRAMQQHDMEAYDLANLRLHQGVLDGAHNPYLIEATRALRSRVKPFRRGQFTRLDRLVQSYEEHSRVVEAILAHDALAAHREMRAHLQAARQATRLLAPQWRDSSPAA